MLVPDGGSNSQSRLVGPTRLSDSWPTIRVMDDQSQPAENGGAARAPAADRLGTMGVWTWTDGMSGAEAAQLATRIESLGYSTLWLPETLGRDPFSHIAHLAALTETLQFATGIANVWNRHPGSMRQAALTVSEASRGRFVLGLGVSHEPIVAGVRKLDYDRPLTYMKQYLAAMAEAPYISAQPEHEPPVVLAALGPKMLELSSTAADGAHPYWTTPEHTATARAALGPEALLCVEQKVVLTEDAAAARSAGAQQLSRYKGLPNYRNNWKRLGFTEDQIEHDDAAFVDAVVAWGTAAQISQRIDEHLEAGATHVCIQPVSPNDGTSIDWAALEALAPGAA